MSQVLPAAAATPPTSDTPGSAAADNTAVAGMEEAATPTSDTPGSAAADNTAVALMKVDPSRPKQVVGFFYTTFAVLAIIGGVVLQFVLNSSPDRIANNIAYEVLTLPGSNTNCQVRPDPDALQFCVMLWGCDDTPETPGGRCGLGPGSVFYTGNAALCVTPSADNPSKKSRIVGASGVYSRNITTYSLTCAGLLAGTSSCLNQSLPKSDVSCELFWPTLRSVITQNIPSSGNITDHSGSFQIQGAVRNDPNIWFHMCGFCSLSLWVEMYAFQSAPVALFEPSHLYTAALS